MNREELIEAPEIERFWAKVVKEPNSGCWLWTGASSHGYGSLRFRGHGCRAHRVAWELHRGAVPNGVSVLHKCDTPLCVNPDHLFLGTQADNIKDAVAKGRIRRGGEAGPSKLTADQVWEIRRRLPTSTVTVLAREFSVAPASIRWIRDGKSWGWLKEAAE